jgi:hypothetical protein
MSDAGSAFRIRTHYDNLQVAETASEEVIKGAYKYLSQKHHPDKNPQNRAEAERISQLINDAYAVLSDPQRRREHDEWIRQERTAQKSAPGQPSNTESSPAPATPTVTPEPKFFKRVWLMLLFVASLAMLLGVFPYQVISGRWEWSYLAVLGFWLWVGHYAYMSLFSPHIIAEEQRQEKERRLAIQPNMVKGVLVGAVTGGIAFGLFEVLLANNPKSQMNFDLFTFGFFVIAGAVVGAFGLKR